MRFLVLMLCVSSLVRAKEAEYNPSLGAGKVEIQRTSFSYHGREVPLKLYLPSARKAPVILLSHGLGGSREVGAYLGKHWAARGYVVVAMQHAGSDESVWKGVPAARRMKAMKKAANVTTFLDRMRDVPATIEQLTKWAAVPKHVLHGRMNLKKIGMAGHSYGAVTTQAVCGQVFGSAGARFADKRIDAGLALSPSQPRKGNSKKAFGAIQLPMMMMTGTKDRSVIGGGTPESRREVYQAMPAGSKYELVLKNAAHMAFSDHTMLGRDHRNPNHHLAIKALSAAFWDAYLKESKLARRWLDGKNPAKVLGSGDLWLRK